HASMMARECLQRARAAGLDFVFKSSFDKANRSSIHSYRGLGMEAGLEVLQQIKHELGVPVLTDVHDVPQDARNIVDKVRETGCEKLLLTERGASFGYNNLVVDMRSLPIMRSFGVPVVFDVTHSLQLPGGLGHATGGQAEYIEPLARAGVACGVDAVFMEVHDCPEKALSDGPNALPLERLESLLFMIRDIHELVRNATRV